MDETNTVVLIAYHFPPDGSAGVHRPLRFVRHLPAWGWRSSVVTVNGNGHGRYDPQLLETVPEETEVFRVPHRDIWQTIQSKREKRFKVRMNSASPRESEKVNRAHQRPIRAFLRTLVRTAEGSFYYPDPARFWIGPATDATVRLCRRNRPRALIATGGPWSSFLVAHNVWRRTGVPYVLDFRDSWTLTSNEDFEAWRPSWATRRDRQLLRKLFQDAQSLIFRYEAEAESYWQAYPGALTSTKVHIIPNGYEGAIERCEPTPGDRCTILYTGTIVPYRDDTFLQALSLLRKSLPGEARRLRVQFVGEGVERTAQAAASLGLADIVTTMDPVPSREATRLQREAHALLLLGVKPYQGYELCGSKVFGYLKAGRPILGVLPADESRKVLEHVGVSTIAHIDAPGEIVDEIKRILDCWTANRLPSLLPDPEKCRVYTAQNQTSALVRALEGHPPLAPFTPGSVEIPDSLKGKIGRNGWIAPH